MRAFFLGWMGARDIKRVAPAMMHYLKRHPFPVLATFDRVVAVSFAFPQGILMPWVPEGLKLDVYEGHGFLTVALVWTRQLRPAGFPGFLGQDFFLAGYRIFTRMRDESGRNLRGLKILRSETESRRMVALGNLMTGYRYRRVDLQVIECGPETHVRTSLPNGDVTLDLVFDATTPDAALPPGSPFPDWRTARRYAGPMPFTFSPEGAGRYVVIEGKRAEWKPRPVSVKHWQVGIFREGPLRDAEPILANAFAVENIDYRWEKGRVVQTGGAG